MGNERGMVKQLGQMDRKVLAKGVDGRRLRSGSLSNKRKKGCQEAKGGHSAKLDKRKGKRQWQKRTRDVKLDRLR